MGINSKKTNKPWSASYKRVLISRHELFWVSASAMDQVHVGEPQEKTQATSKQWINNLDISDGKPIWFSKSTAESVPMNGLTSTKCIVLHRWHNALSWDEGMSQYISTRCFVSSYSPTNTFSTPGRTFWVIGTLLVEKWNEAIGLLHS